MPNDRGRALGSVWAFLLSVVGIAVTVVGIQTSAFLFDWGDDTLVHRDRIVAGASSSWHRR